MSTLIRPILPCDFDGVYDLYMDETVNPYMLYDPMDKASFQTVFDELCSRDYSWMAEQDSKIRGMCFATKGYARFRHVATLLTLAVSTDAQGQGLGRKLVTEALGILKSDGFLRIDLMVEADNENGVRFYKKMGFQVDGRLPMYFRRHDESKYVDEIQMSITYG
jgi:putative acetyltransferase